MLLSHINVSLTLSLPLSPSLSPEAMKKMSSDEDLKKKKKKDSGRHEIYKIKDYVSFNHSYIPNFYHNA